VGYRLGGRYRVKTFADTISGWGVRARDEQGEADVVLHVIDPKIVQSADDRSQFMSMCRQARRVDHVNVARVLDEGEDSKTVFYVMPLIEGLSLRRIIDLRLEKKEVFTFKETLPLFNQLADGLSKLGRMKFHGGLAPETVVVLPDLLKITALPNFHGLPRRPHVVKHEAWGAIHYIAPEARSETAKPDGRADVYSLAVILTEMMTGCVHGRDSNAKLKGARELLGKNLVEVMRRALSTDPAKRHDNVSTFVDAVFDQVDEADFPVVELEEDDPDLLHDQADHTFDDLEFNALTLQPPTLALSDEQDGAATGELEVSADDFEVDLGEVAAVPKRDAVPISFASGRVEETLDGADTLQSFDDGPNTGDIGVVSEVRKAKITELPPTRAIPRTNDQVKPTTMLAVGIVLVGLMLSLVILFSSDSEPPAIPPVVTAPVVEPPTELVVEPTEVQVEDGEPSAAPALAEPVEVVALPVQRVEATSSPAPEPTTSTPTLAPTPPVALSPVADDDPIELPPELPAPPAEPAVPAESSTKPPPPPPPPAVVVPRPAAEPVAAAEAESEVSEPTCRRGMLMIEAGAFTYGTRHGDPMRGFGDRAAERVIMDAYCIDIYEYPNTRGRTPKVKTSWASADSSCRARGKRLCTEMEWERACKGRTGTRFPFGNQFQDGLCNLSTESSTGKVGLSGAFQKCRSGFGVADMAGNVAEWTSSQWSGDVPDKVVKGGAADQGMYSGRCGDRANESASTRSDTLGFRCCADSQ
jgi:formylglycine-generating enzyme required for sulfatase activity/serine/threonine protein kinase